MVDQIVITREQLAPLANGDRRLLLALEQLFQNANEIAAGETGAAFAFNAAIFGAGLDGGGNQFQMPAMIDEQATPIAMPAPQFALEDVNPADGDLLKYNEAEGRWEAISGASGSFTAGSGEAITVTNGIITGIV